LATLGSGDSGCKPRADLRPRAWNLAPPPCSIKRFQGQIGDCRELTDQINDLGGVTHHITDMSADADRHRHGLPLRAGQYVLQQWVGRQAGRQAGRQGCRRLLLRNAAAACRTRPVRLLHDTREIYDLAAHGRSSPQAVQTSTERSKHTQRATACQPRDVAAAGASACRERRWCPACRQPRRHGPRQAPPLPLGGACGRRHLRHRVLVRPHTQPLSCYASRPSCLATLPATVSAASGGAARSAAAVASCAVGGRALDVRAPRWQRGSLCPSFIPQGAVHGLAGRAARLRPQS
jgi:hypothetical protein